MNRQWQGFRMAEILVELFHTMNRIPARRTDSISDYGYGVSALLRQRKKGIIRSVFIFVILLLSMQCHANADAIADHSTVRQNKQSKGTDFKTNLPNGLYLYKSKKENNVFSPLFIANDGRLIDPYIAAEKIGQKMFINKYVQNKTFNVVTGSTEMGELSNIILNFEKHAQTKEFVKNIEVNGNYKGKDLQAKDIIGNSFFTEKDFFNFAFPKFIATPQKYFTGLESEFSISKQDIEKILEKAKEHFLPEAQRIVSEEFKIENRIIIGSESSIDYAWAIDLEQNGKKVIVGCYSIAFIYKDQDYKVIEQQKGGYDFEILFSYRENGEIKQISMSDGKVPGFSLINAIDLNGDGIKEIIIESNRELELEDSSSGKSIEIFSLFSHGWEKIFQSAKIMGMFDF